MDEERQERIRYYSFAAFVGALLLLNVRTLSGAKVGKETVSCTVMPRHQSLCHSAFVLRGGQIDAMVSVSDTEAVSQIKAEGRTFALREPVELSSRRQGPYHFVGISELSIEGYGNSEDEALASFADVFSATWDAYAKEKDSKLTRDARELKRNLKSLVVEVHTVSNG